MNHIDQVQKRLEILNIMITTYKSMSHAVGTSKKDIDDMLFVLSEWKNETELLLQALKYYEKQTRK